MPSWNPVPATGALEGKILTTRPVDTLQAELQETKVIIRGRERRGFKLVLRDDQNSEGGLFRFHISLLRNFDVKHPFIALNGQVLPAKLVNGEWIEVEIPHFSTQTLEIFSGSYSERWNDKTNGDTVTLSLANVHSPTNVKVRAIGRKGAWTIGGETFQCRMPVTVDNSQNASALTDYQVKVVVDTASLIAAGKMNADCSDVRFTDSDGATKIPYYLEPGTENTASTVFWVKVPSIPASGSTTIYMYYGNPSAVSESDADAVFELFDDFEGTDIDTTKWTDIHAGSQVTYSVANSKLSVTILSGTSGLYFSMRTIKQFPNDIVIHEKIDSISIGDATDIKIAIGTGTGLITADGDYATNFGNGYVASLRYRSTLTPAYSARLLRFDDDTDSWTTLAEVEHQAQAGVYEFRRFGGDLEARKDSSLLTSATDSTYIANFYMRHISRGSSIEGISYEIDYIFIRKYADPEPSTSLGAEEAAALNTQGAAVSVNGSAAIDLMYVNGSPVTELLDGQAGDWIDIDPALLNQGDGVTNTLTISTANNSRVDIEIMMDYKDDVVIETFTFSTPNAGIVGEVKDTEITISADTSSPRFDFAFSKQIDSVQAVRYELNDAGIVNLTTDPTARPYYATSGNILTVYPDDPLLAGDKINIRAGVSFQVSEKPPIYTSALDVEVEKKEVILEVRLS
jgi:Fe-S cluster assembly iron-binding protein IscA